MRKVAKGETDFHTQTFVYITNRLPNATVRMESVGLILTLNKPDGKRNKLFQISRFAP